MNQFCVWIAVGIVVGLLLFGCALSHSAVDTGRPTTPKQFLLWSMERYGAMAGFRAECAWSMLEREGKMGLPTHRSIVYRAPDRFRVVSHGPTGFVMTAVCDGTRLVEYSNHEDQPASTYPSPDSISDAGSMLMNHPMFCGSLLYQFFGGSKNLAGLVDLDKGAISFGSKQKAEDGEPSREVDFYGQGTYGHVSVLIGERTGLVHRIEYDNEPLMRMMDSPEMQDTIRSQIRSRIAVLPPGQERSDLEKTLAEVSHPVETKTQELYSHIAMGSPVDSETFDTSLPKGLEVREVGASSSGKPPVPLGHPAPDFEVTSLDGKPIRLSSFRGKTVLIDFWATWCGPCREGLPETNHLAELGETHNLHVMAVSGEEAETVRGFLKAKGYRFPAYLDPGGRAQALYKVGAIPTTVVIDAEGRLIAYLVGLHEPSDVESALRKAGAAI
jgi:peroxiredoxin